MSRPLRIQFPGAIYHVTARGDRKEPIYDDHLDRVRFLEILEEVVTVYNWGIHAYCLMGNHYHLVIETPDANLSKGMRHLNGVYTQASNRRHERVGHLFQGRYKAILVDADAYLLELARYVVLNPVRAGLVDVPASWPWSSYLAMVAIHDKPDWLLSDRLLAHFSSDRAAAVKRYSDFVHAGIGQPSIWRHLRGQIFLGDEAFARQILETNSEAHEDVDIPMLQKRPPAPKLEQFARQCVDRDSAIVAAYATGQYNYLQIGIFFGLHFTTVGTIVRKARQAR